MSERWISLIAVLLSAIPVSAQLNDFTANWSPIASTPQLATGIPTLTDRQVTLTSLGGPSSLTGIGTNCSLNGDFDVQVDFALENWPVRNGYALTLQAVAVPSDSQHFEVGIESDPDSNNDYFLSSQIGGSGFPTFDVSGKLRLIRSGSSVQGYILSQSGDAAWGYPVGTWIPLSSVLGNFLGSPTSSGGPVGLILSLYTRETSNGAAGIEAEFSNFQVNSGSVLCPVPKGLGIPSPSNPVGTASEPISTANGNYYNQHIDFTLPSRGAPLLFERTYNSLATYAGPLGAHWTDSFNIALNQDSSGNVTIQWGDGHFETYTATPSGFVPQPGVFSSLTKNGDGSFTLLTKDQRIYNFTPAGQLTNIQDRNGNTTALIYDSPGLLHSVTAAGGESLVFSYDSNNRISQISDPIGRTVKFSYSTANDLAQVIDAAGGVTTYTYDSSHRMLSATLPNGNLLLQNSYDSSGRVIAQTNGRGFTTALAYDTPAQNQTTITDPLGNRTTHTYDSSLRIVQITDAAGKNISYSYDVNNDRTGVTNQNGKTTTFSYDSQGNITGITDSLGNASSFAYDAKNDLLTATNPRGNTTQFSYDGNGNLMVIQDALGNKTAFSYDAFGELLSKKDANGNTTNYTYDSSGKLTQINDALGHATALTYDGIGRLTSITDPNDHAATATYDTLSRLVRIADPLGDATQFAYDPVGNLLKVIDADGHATSYAYDATSNLISVTDALGHVTQYAYDADNNRIGFTNANGNATSYAYDSLNRLVQITDPLSFKTSYSYDPVGNVVATTDAKGQTNQFAYDTLNHLLSISYADGKSVAYSYDADGNRLSMTDSRGATMYAYNALDRLTSVTNPGTKIVAYAYDPLGNRQSLTYPDGKAVMYAYDAANRLTQVTDWLGRKTAYSYDAAGNLTGTADPNGTSSSLTYDPANRLTGIVNSLVHRLPVKLTYTLDAVGNRTSFGIDGISTKYSYDPLNELIDAQLGPLRATWSYDAVGNRTRASSLLGPVGYSYDADDRLLASGKTTYTYDADGNQTSVTKAREGDWDRDRDNAAESILYGYDAANRLVSATGGREDSTFAYDGDGNRISQAVGAGTYSYLNDVASSLPVVLQESGPDGNISYAYGLNRISESASNFDYFYQYDGLGSVITLSDEIGRPAAGYLYDAWGNSLLDMPDRVGTRNKFRFTGEALDPGTGLYYLRARYYATSVGRFAMKDSFAGAVLAPVSENRFIYAWNRPTTLTDPLGLMPQQLATIVLTAPHISVNPIDSTSLPSPTPLDLYRFLTSPRTAAEVGSALLEIPIVGPPAAAVYQAWSWGATLGFVIGDTVFNTDQPDNLRNLAGSFHW